MFIKIYEKSQIIKVRDQKFFIEKCGYISIIKAKIMIKGILITVHILLCFILVVIVLLQKGKGADIGAVFGGTSQTLFGSTGATSFLQKLTIVIAAGFILTSLGLSVFLSQTKKSVMDNVKIPVTEQQTQQVGEK